MANRIKREVKRSQVWARVFLSGPTGSGKTRGAFELASRLFGGVLPIVLANTEPNRGEMYADRFPIEALIDLEGDYHPERFIEAIDAAEQIAPGGALILDSATHEWYGSNGVTQLASRFGDWAKVRPMHQKFVDRMQLAQMHIIVCCRAKMKYEQVEVDGKQTVVTLGVGPMQDADFPYEFSLWGEFDRTSHEVAWSGHIDSLQGTAGNLVEDADKIADTLTTWLSQGDPIIPVEAASPEDVETLIGLLKEAGIAEDVIEEKLAVARRENRGALSPAYVEKNIANARTLVATKARKEAAARAAAQAEPAEAAATT